MQVTIPRCFQLSHKLEGLLKYFCYGGNINQRGMIEIGLVETLRKYVYEAEIKGILNS